MIQIICGEKGKGKTKQLLLKANDAANKAHGVVVYFDKSSKKMYELNNKIRLINVSEYPVVSYDSFIGFVSGLLSGNHDIEYIFFDNFLEISTVEKKKLSDAIASLDRLSKSVTFTLCITMSESDIPDNLKDKIIVSC